jgi:hypothetical protein
VTGPAGSATFSGPTNSVLFYDGSVIAGSSLFRFDPTSGPTGEVFIDGKLTVKGGIDPLYLQLTPQTTNPLPGVTGTIWYNETTGSIYLDNNLGGIGSTGETGPTGSLGTDPIVSSIRVSSFTSTNSLTVYGTTDTYFEKLKFITASIPNIAIGQQNQVTGIASLSSSIAIGVNAGQSNQAARCIAIGLNAGRAAQANNSVAIGFSAGNSQSGSQCIAIGTFAGNVSQTGINALAIGSGAGSSGQGAGTVAIGSSAGATSQGTNAIAIGSNAGNSSQTNSAIAIGTQAGQTSQATQCIAIGVLAQTTSPAGNAIGIGLLAGNTRQSTNAVAIGTQAGQNNQGNFAVALGFQAGQTAQHASSIIINASGTALNSVQGNSTYIRPLRNLAGTVTGFSNVYYNPTTGELAYS